MLIQELTRKVQKHLEKMNEKQIIACEQILHNFKNRHIKIAVTSEVNKDSKYQLLCIVTASDEIIFRYVSEITSEIILKKVDWFSEKKKIIKGTSINNLSHPATQ